MANYILRKVDDTLMRAFRDRCTAEGRTQRWVILELIRRYIEKGLEK